MTAPTAPTAPAGTRYKSEVHYAAQILARELRDAGVETVEAYHDVCDANEAIDAAARKADAGTDVETLNAISGLANILLSDDSTVFGRWAEANCAKCDEAFNPNGDEAVIVTDDDQFVLFEHYQTADESECGGFGPILGEWT